MTDEKDAVLIARLTAQLRCYIPKPVDETWGRLRHLGARREHLIVETASQVQQIRDLLECVWPAAPERQPTTPSAPGPGPRPLTIIPERDGGDLRRTARLGLPPLLAAVRRELR